MALVGPAVDDFVGVQGMKQFEGREGHDVIRAREYLEPLRATDPAAAELVMRMAGIAAKHFVREKVAIIKWIAMHLEAQKSLDGDILAQLFRKPHDVAAEFHAAVLALQFVKHVP